MIFVFKHKTAYEMRISDWSPDVCSSYLLTREAGGWLITAHDRTFRARALVNAAGPFVLDLLHDAHQPTERRMRFVRGSHIVVPKLFDHGFAYFFQQIGRESCRERVCQYV